MIRYIRSLLQVDARRVAMAAVLMTIATGTTAWSQQQALPVVETALPLQRDVTDYDVFTGRIIAVQDIELRSRISGFVEQVNFVDGDLVAQGQVLFVLDQRRALADVTRNEALVRQAEAQLRLAESEFIRAQTLLERNAISREEADQRASAAAVAEAGIASAQALLDIALIELADTEVRAPFAGRISYSRVDTGDLVERSTVLVTIASIDPMEIVFDATETDYLRYVRLDLAGRALSSRSQPADVAVRLADEDGWPHPGQINFIDNRLDQASGSIRVRAQLPNPQGLFAPGLFARVRVPLVGPYPALLLPDDAILADQAGQIVYVLNSDGMVEARAVQTGQIVDGLRLIRSGLEPDERVVVGGVMRVRVGAPVSAQDVDLSTRLFPEAQP
jgi:multidrug efflux system membrane fusion protein